jgi:hypothetical protein
LPVIMYSCSFAVILLMILAQVGLHASVYETSAAREHIICDAFRPVF